MSTEFRRFQMLYDTRDNWISTNPVLLLAEIGVETDTSKFKIGDGVTAWNSLAYATGSSGTATAAFGTVSVSGEDDVVATLAPDTLTLVAGTNIGITTNAGADSVTIATSGLGTAATKDTGTGAGHVILGNDVRLTDARTPSAHKASHQHGGSDEIATATPTANAIPKTSLGLITLAAGWIPDLSGTYAVTAKGVTNGDSHDHVGGDGAAIVEAAITLADNETNNASTSKHGLLKKLSNVATEYMSGTGVWSTPAGGSASNSFATIACPAGTNPVADSATDTLTLTAGSGITITGDESSDAIAFAVSGVPDTALTLTDETTKNASISAHGFLKKLSNVATQYMDGSGAWSVPAQGVATSAFATINCPAGTDPVATSPTDILNLAVSGSGLTITGNSSSDTITFALSGIAITSVATKTDLRAVDTTLYQAVYMRGRDTDGDAGAGLFDWSGGNYQSICATDSAQGIYVPPTGQNGSAGAWIRRRNSNEVRPEWFGSTYTHVELQAAASMIINNGSTMIIPANSKWLIGATVTFPAVTFLRVTSDAQVGYYPWLQASTTSLTNGLLKFVANCPSVSNITFSGTDTEISTSNTGIAYGTSKGLVFDNSVTYPSDETGANIDGEVTQCGFVGLHTGVYGKGRNVQIMKCTFSISRYGVYGDQFTWNSGTGIAQFRGWEVRDCRFHVMGSRVTYAGTAYSQAWDDVETCCIRTPIDSQVRIGLRGVAHIIVANNSADLCGSIFYKGSLHGVHISDNYCHYACGPFIMCDAVAAQAPEGYINYIDSSQIVNNCFDGTAQAGAVDYWGEPPFWFYAQYVANLTIRGNTASNTTGFSIALYNHYNCTICDNDFSFANISYGRGDIDDAPCISIGGDTVYDDTHQTWINGNRIWGGDYTYAIYVFGNEHNVRCGLNYMTEGRSGLVWNWADSEYGNPSFIYIDQSKADSGAFWGDIVLNPAQYYGKTTGQRTRINGNLAISGDFVLQSYITTKVATGTLTEAQLEALHTTPITVIAAPGSGKAIVVVGAQFFYDYVAAYGVDAGDDLVLKYTDGSGATILQVETTGFLDTTSDQMRYSTPTTTAEFNPVANAVVVAYLLGALSATGSSTVKYRIEYKVIDTSW